MHGCGGSNLCCAGLQMLSIVATPRGHSVPAAPGGGRYVCLFLIVSVCSTIVDVYICWGGREMRPCHARCLCCCSIGHTCVPLYRAPPPPRALTKRSLLQRKREGEGGGRREGTGGGGEMDVAECLVVHLHTHTHTHTHTRVACHKRGCRHPQGVRIPWEGVWHSMWHRQTGRQHRACCRFLVRYCCIAALVC